MNIRFQIPNGELAVKYLERDSSLPTIIFLHDSLGCIKTWRTFPEEIAEITGCNYLVYDRLGYGESTYDPNALNRKKDYLEKEANILIDLIEDLEIKNPILFGHSDGGTIALIAASIKNNLIKGVIAEAAHIYVEEITLEGVQKVKHNYLKGLKAILVKYHGVKSEDVFYSWANTWLDKNFRDWNIKHFLPKLACPCLIIQGDQDEFGSLDQVHDIQQNIRGKAEIAVIENVGHSPHKEESTYIIKLTCDFINQNIM